LKKIVLDNVELEYKIFQSLNKETETGMNSIENNIVLIHGGIIADSNIPLVPFFDLLIKSYNILHYHRSGYGKSINKKNEYTSILKHVEDCKGLMDFLNIKRAHLIGHSIGGTIALQLASTHPDYIKSLILLEPAITGYSKFTNEQVIQEFQPIVQMYDKGQKNEAIDIFMKIAIGTNYKEIIANVLPSNSFELAVADANTFFHEEIPSMRSWTFTKTQTKDLINTPVLHIRGIQKARKISKKRGELLKYWLPQTVNTSISNAPHMLQITNTKEVIHLIKLFFQQQINIL
jgi:pimeloyl-ACP methyl ester carboxylesterase